MTWLRDFSINSGENRTRFTSGVQHSSYCDRKALLEFALRGSMGRRGNPYDNAKADSFMKTLKCEHVYLNEYRNFAEVVEGVPQIALGPWLFATSAIRGATRT